MTAEKQIEDPVENKIVLKDAYKGYSHDLDKSIKPEDTVRRFRERLKVLDLDILEDTVRIDKGRLGIPVYLSLCGRDAEELIGSKKQMGKGGTPQQAEASAVMELAERFSLFSFWKRESNFIVEKYKNIEDRALPFEYIAASVHDTSEEVEQAREIFSELPLRWTGAYNLTQDREVLIPFDWFFEINQYNGSSAGNCIEEAVLQGICEVVERHVSAIISRERGRVPLIDPDTVSDKAVLDMLDGYRKAGVRLYVSDFSLDMGIPSIGVLAYDPSTFPGRSEIVWTAGTTTSPEKSLSRALSETAQLAGDFNTGSSYEASGLPKFRDLGEADFITGSKEIAPLHSLPDISDDNFRVEVENCTTALHRKGMEVILVDLTHPQLDIPAFYTLVPGACFRERAAGASVGLFSAKLISQAADPEWAFNELDKADRILPGKYYIRFFQGLLCLNMNDPRKALPYLKEALEMNPEDQEIAGIYSYIAVCLKELECYSEAIQMLETAESYDKDRTDIYNLKGFCYFKVKEHEKAIECFNQVLRLNPSSAIDYANIGSNYREMGDKEKAIRYYRFALDLDPTIDFARANLKRLQEE